MTAVLECQARLEVDAVEFVKRHAGVHAERLKLGDFGVNDLLKGLATERMVATIHTKYDQLPWRLRYASSTGS